MSETSAPAYAGYGTKPYRAYILAALVTVYTFNFIDRIVLGVVQEQIRNDLHLKDWHLGLLGGPAFAVLYSLLGIPIARLAEKRNRMTILSVCVGLWSIMTALCGLATNFLTLFLCRIGVGIGEAGCTPPAQSVIGDYFPSDKRATAISIYTMGIPLGSMLAALGGGWIAQTFGWQQSFLLLGVPGLILAVLVKLTIKEPPRSAEASETPSFAEALKVLKTKATFWHVSAGCAAASFTGYGAGQFSTSFFMRTHDLTILEASRITGVMMGVFGTLGAFLAGFIADRVAKRHPNALCWLPAFGFIVAAIMNIAGYLSSSLYVALPLLATALVFGSFNLGPMYAIAQGIVHPRMRATSVAIMLFIMVIVGYGLGPPAVGLLSDVLANFRLNQLGLSPEVCEGMSTLSTGGCAEGTAFGLKYAMISAFTVYFIASLHFALAWRTLQKDWHR